jgi:hypothetical protein
LKIAIVNDIHQGARSDSLDFNAHFMRFWDNIFSPELEKRPDITDVWILGDIVDRRKFINYMILQEFQSVVDRLAKYNVHILVGNHDIYLKNANVPNAPSLLFGQHGWHIYDKPTHVYYGDISLCVVPWIDPKYQPEEFIHAGKFIQNSKSEICFGHFELLGHEQDRGNVSLEGYVIDALDKFDVVMSGHFHHKSSKGNVEYLGCPYEITWADYGSQKGFHIFDLETKELEFIENPNHMFYLFHYNDTNPEKLKIMKDVSKLKNNTDLRTAFGNKYVKIVVYSKTDPFLLDKVREVIEAHGALDISIQERKLEEGETEEDNVSDEDELALSMLETSEATINSYIEEEQYTDDIINKLKLLMRDLYIEAVSIDKNNEGFR